MRYYGGKARIAKELVAFMSDLNSEARLPYFEPFMGGANVFVRMCDAIGPERCWGCDANADIMRLFLEFKRGWTPPQVVHHETFTACQRDVAHGMRSAYHSFVGFGCSYGGIYYDSYARPKDGRMPSRDAYNFFMKNERELRTAQYLEAASYDSWAPRGMLIYCDPPAPYHDSSFDREQFWKTMRKWSLENVVLIGVSKTLSQGVPSDFKQVLHISHMGSSPRTEGQKQQQQQMQQKDEFLYAFCDSIEPLVATKLCDNFPPPKACQNVNL